MRTIQRTVIGQHFAGGWVDAFCQASMICLASSGVGMASTGWTWEAGSIQHGDEREAFFLGAGGLVPSDSDNLLAMHFPVCLIRVGLETKGANAAPAATTKGQKVAAR